MKLKSKRTQEEFEVLSNEDEIYVIDLGDGTTKELAESTVKRWYSIIDDVEKTKQVNNVKPKTDKDLDKVEPKDLDVSLVKKAQKPKKVRTISNREFKSKIALLLTEYVHGLGLKINKQKEYVGAYTSNKKKVVEIRSSRKGVKISVRPMVYLLLEEKEQKKCFYLSEKSNLHFRTTMEITSTNDLDLAKKLISLSLQDMEG